MVRCRAVLCEEDAALCRDGELGELWSVGGWPGGGVVGWEEMVSMGIGGNFELYRQKLISSLRSEKCLDTPAVWFRRR